MGARLRAASRLGAGRGVFGLRATYLAEREQRERWRELLANETVRRGELRPGESVEGIVLFPRLAYPGRTELILIAGPAIARFRYAAGLRG